MWRAYGPETGLWALVALFATGCGTRSLDMMIVPEDPNCSLSINGARSIIYEVFATPTATPASDTDPPLCRSLCLPVAGGDSISDITQLLNFVRDKAPECKGVHPGTYLQVRLKAWRSLQCAASESQPSPIFCGAAVPVAVPNGRQDDKVTLKLPCNSSCGSGG